MQAAQGGRLRVNDVIYEEFIPAIGTFDGSLEFSIDLSSEDGGSDGVLTVQAKRVSIELCGVPSDKEVFKGYNNW